MTRLPQNLFVDGKINPEIINLIKTHPVIADNKPQYESIVKLLNQAALLFGQELICLFSGHNSNHFFSLNILQGGLSEGSIYLGPKKGLIFSLQLEGKRSERASEENVTLSLHSLIAREVIKTSSKKETITPLGRKTVLGAAQVLIAYKKRLTRYTKKHNLTEDEAFMFVNALELYSEYTVRHQAPLNIPNYLARAIKAGMNVEKAVWMVYNKHSIDLAADYKDIPTTWVLRI